MKQKNRSFLRMGILVLVILLALTFVVAIAGASLAAVPERAPLNAPPAAPLPEVSCDLTGVGIRSCELWAITGTLTLPGVMPGATIEVPIWGYTDTAPTEAGMATLPGGPPLIVHEGDAVVVTLHNDLEEATALIFPGQDMIPDLAGTPPGSTTDYSFNAIYSGTYMYEAGLLPNAPRQVAMGLYGGLIVRPSNPAQAYGEASDFNVEALLVLSEIDTNLNDDPANFDMRDYSPQYRLINGKVYPETAEIPALAEQRVLLRYVNGGIQQHTMGVLGMDQELIARDGGQRPYPQTELVESIGPGRTADAIVTIPDSAVPGSKYAVYDSSMLLHNNGDSFGGMLTFLTVGAGTPPQSVGPTTDQVALSENPTDGSVTVVISATITGATSSPIFAAEYFTYTGGTAGEGNAMLANDGNFDSPTEAVSATISLADLALLPHGDTTIYVHGSDGTWGAFNFAVLHLDKLGPVTTGITLAPNPSDGSVDVAVNATGNDSATGNSNIIAAEYFTDTIGADGTGTPMTPNQVAPIASLDGTISPTLLLLDEGTHTIYVHSMDRFGHWGTLASATLVVDQTGPDTSNVRADPNPNNGSTPYNPTVFAVRVDATLNDPLSPDDNSNIQRAEGFINNDSGVAGTGFPLSPVDGLFNESTEDAYVYIPLSTIGPLGVGTHQIYVHAQDSSGNWGDTAFVDFVIEVDSPVVADVTVDPTSGEAGFTAVLTATATDDSEIVLAEWFAGADPGAGNGTPMTVTFNDPDWALEANVDTTGWAASVRQLNVRARDAAGNWSPAVSVDLTVNAGQQPEPMLLYFSTLGTGELTGVATPYDDADVYLWDATDFSRFLDGTAAGLPGNADIDGLAIDGGLFYLSFNRNSNTNVPGVGRVEDEDVVSYNPGDLQWELVFAGVDVCDGMDASNGHDIDAFDVLDGVFYFSTAGNAAVSGTAGPYDDADIYMVGGAGCSRIFDATVAGLPGTADIDGLTVVDEDTFYISFNGNDIIVPDIVGLVQDEDIILYDALAVTPEPVWSLFFDGSVQGLDASNNHDLDAIDVQ